MRSLTLYTAKGCHLCELALCQIEASACYDFIALKEVDISDNTALVRLFGTRIPVVCMDDTGDQLSWPFDAIDFCTWLNLN
ncbi:MAG: glutaredoxin family protein [Cellvibrionaceae bacterium]|nr:glutaredoxin family protein [Cellvibrionaceae bacterium]